MNESELYREIKEKKNKELDPGTISWQRDQVRNGVLPIIYKFPQQGDTFKKKKYFAIKDYERALFYNKGELVGVLKGGVYELDKKAKIKGTEIIWFDTGFIEIQWGIAASSGIPTLDGFVIGLHGDLKLKISDIKTFYHNVVSGKLNFSSQDLKDFIHGFLQSSLRDIFKKYDAINIIREDRERIVNLVIAKVSEEFLQYGLDLETINIRGIKSSQNIEDMFLKEREAKISDQKTSKSIIEALFQEKEEVQKRIITLKKRIRELQDLYLDEKISGEEYDKKEKQIQEFIDKAEQDLREIDDKVRNA